MHSVLRVGKFYPLEGIWSQRVLLDYMCSFISWQDPQQDPQPLPPHTPSTTTPPPPHPDATVCKPYLWSDQKSADSTWYQNLFQAPENTEKHPDSCEDPVPPEEKIGVVYWVPCGDCPATYVGQTRMTLIHCLKEHKRAQTTANPMDAALVEHAINTGHEIDWSDTRVIDANPLLHQHCNLESQLAHLSTTAPLTGRYTTRATSLWPAELAHFPTINQLSHPHPPFILFL